MRYLPLLAALLLLACEPAPSLPQTGAQVRVLLTDGADLTGWLPWQRDAIRALMPAMNATGDQWVLLEAGEADVTLRTFAAPERGHLAGRYVPSRRLAEIDTTQVHGVAWLQLAVAHELLHHRTYVATGRTFHVCVRPGDVADCHATITGPAILNPELPSDAGDGFDSPYTTPRTALYQGDLDAVQSR